MKVVARTISTGENIMIENFEVVSRSFAKPSVKEINSDFERRRRELEIVKGEFEYIFREFDRVSFRDIYDAYEFFERVYSGSRIESIREFARAMMELIEVIADKVGVQVFSFEKRRAFIKNLARVMDDLGIKLEILTFGYSMPIIFQLEELKTGKKKLFRIDTESFKHIFENDKLYELTSENSMLVHASPGLKKEILSLLKKYFEL